MASIKEVAKHANVAISTVSKVLNDYPNISEETKRKVKASIEELSYVPNSIASALSSKKTGRVAILINVSTQTRVLDEIGMQYLSGAIHQAKELGMDIITVFFSMLEGKSMEEIERYLLSKSINGILIFGISKESKDLLALIQKERFKIVVVDAPFVNKMTSSIWVNQKKAQYDVAKITCKGHTIKKILYIAGEKNGFVTDERIEGILEFAKDYQYKLTIKNGDFSEKRARDITFKYAKENDIVICASDLMAIGAMNALTEMDIFRPVCGFDGITLMGYIGKQMHTVDQNFYYIAQEAIKELKELLSGQEGKEIVLEYKLVRLEYKDIIR